MIVQIMVKELRQGLLSLRFSVSTLLVLCLFAIGGFIFNGRYAQQHRDHPKHVQENVMRLRQAADRLCDLVMLEQSIRKVPRVLSFGVNGYGDVLPNEFRFDPFVVQLPEVKTSSSAFLPHFSRIDWTFIISTIISFLALLMSYDCICGEKQAGTLRLILCGTLSRSTVLMAKYLGIMLSLGVALLLGLITHLLIVGSAPEVQLGLNQWFRIGTLIILSLVYISVFVWIGLFVSCRVHLENHSMVILLLVWVGLVFLVPSFGRIAADMICPAPAQTERERELSDVLQDVADECSAGKFGENAGNWNSYTDNPPAAARYHQARGRARSQVVEKHFNQLVDQVETGRRITALSPRVLYQRAAESIAGVGVCQVIALYKQIKDYQNVLQEFIIDRDARDPESNHLFFPFPSELIIERWEPISQRPVDFDIVPQFRERPMTLGRSLVLIIWDVGVLVLINVVFFVATYVSFLRYDVR